MRLESLDMKSLISNKVFWIILLFVVGLSINFDTYGGSPIFDDYSFLFSSDRFLDAPNPFVFWDFRTKFFRSWPLTFSSLWVIYQVFGTKFLVYKLINVLLHITNCILIYLGAVKFRIPFAPALALMFLVHPAQIESISWIFQFKTLLSILLFLLSYWSFLESFDKRGGHRYGLLGLSWIFFSLSMAAKITAIFFPLLYIWHFFKNLGFKNLKLGPTFGYGFFLVLILMSSQISGRETLNGVDVNPLEQKEELVLDETFERVEKKEIEVSFHRSREFQSSKLFEWQSFNAYRDTMSFYISQAVLNIYNTLVFSKDFFHTKLGLAYIVFGVAFLVFTSLLIIWRGFFSYYTLGFLIFFLAYIPVSGVRYVPYMKFSPIADHWGYFAYLGIFLILILLIDELKKVKYLNKVYIWILPLIILSFGFKFIKYNKVFNDEYLLLEHGIKHNPEELTLLLAKREYHLRHGQTEQASKMLEILLQKDQFHFDLGLGEFLLEYYNSVGENKKYFQLLCELAIRFATIQDLDSLDKIVKKMVAANSVDPRTKYFMAIKDLLLNRSINAENIFN